MAPKEAVALTPAEQKMLTAVISLMGDVPEVDFSVVAQLVGQKYSRNARASCKKLFDKLRATGDSQPGGAALTTTPVTSDAEEGDEARKKTPAKATTKKPAAAANKVVKKGVAKLAPKRTTATKGPAKGRGKKEVAAKEEEAEDEEVIDEDADEGKSILSDPFVDTSVKKTPEEIEAEDFENAALRAMSLADWKAWKAANPYEAALPFVPATPLLEHGFGYDA